VSFFHGKQKETLLHLFDQKYSQEIIKNKKNNFLIYFCDGNGKFSAAITPVFRAEVCHFEA